MPAYRVMVVRSGASGIPEDRYVNTYHWERLDGIDAFADAVAPAMERLHTAIHEACGVSYIQSAAEVRVYDMADGEPRVPTIRPIDIGTAAGPANVPFEVALVSSFVAAPPITPRKRGRAYYGPITVASIGDGTSTVAPSVNMTVVGVVNDAHEALYNEPGLAGWSIRSAGARVPSAPGAPPGALLPEAYYPIVGGFTDNEFDTQRKRGHQATNRLTWSAP